MFWQSSSHQAVCWASSPQYCCCPPWRWKAPSRPSSTGNTTGAGEGGRSGGSRVTPAILTSLFLLRRLCQDPCSLSLIIWSPVQSVHRCPNSPPPLCSFFMPQPHSDSQNWIPFLAPPEDRQSFTIILEEYTSILKARTPIMS